MYLKWINWIKLQLNDASSHSYSEEKHVIISILPTLNLIINIYEQQIMKRP